MQILKNTTIISLLLLIFLFNLVGYFFHCFPTTDFGIYQEAIYKIATFDSLNPYINVRGINIFNDHFDPVIILGAPFVWLTGFHPSGVLLFQMSWIVGSLIILRKSLSKELFFIFALFLLFSRGVAGGLVFPIHPTTWSVFGILLLFYFISRNNEKGIIFSALLVSTYKELFPACIFCLSFYFLYKKQKRVFWSLFIPSFIWSLFVFWLRPKVMGPVFPYSDRVLSKLFSTPVEFFIDLFKYFNYSDLFKLVFPFVIPLYFILRNRKNDSIVIPVFLFSLPLWGAHILSNIFYLWNVAHFSALFLALMIFSDFPNYLKERKLLGVFLVILFIVSGGKYYEKAFKLLVMRDSKTCEISSKRVSELNEFHNKMSELPDNAKVLATSGITPWVMRPGLYPYYAGEYSKKMYSFEYLALERSHKGFITPYTKEDIESFINSCPGSDVMIKNESFYLAKGPFNKGCLDKIFTKWAVYPSNY